MPERYNDADFRTQFLELTTQEVDRLNGMIDQLDEYAHPARLRFAPVNVQDLFDTALSKARGNNSETKTIQMDVETGLPSIYGDLDVLADAISRLLQNAFSAVEGRSHASIQLKAAFGEIGTGRSAVVIEVCDNGPGIPAELLGKVYSPFCTTKPRGVGLGLPIVRRTMIDHGGLVSIRSDGTGTAIHLALPAVEAGRGAGYAKTVDRRR